MIEPALTILTEPGGNSSSWATVNRANSLGDLELAGEPRPLFWQRRPLGAMQRDLQYPEPQQRALEPDRRERDLDLLEQLLFRQRRHIARRPALDHLRQHRRRCLGDRAAATLGLVLV